MTVQQIADRLAELCRKAEWKKAQSELFDANAVSIEQRESPGFAKETRGLDNIHKKSDQFDSMVEEFHGLTTSAPMIAGNSFAIKMDMDMTMKGQGRQKMSELCVYETKDGKIVSEQFFM